MAYCYVYLSRQKASNIVSECKTSKLKNSSVWLFFLQLVDSPKILAFYQENQAQRF